MKFQFHFERGGTLTMTTLAEAHKSIECISKMAPINANIFQARWSGREIFIPTKLKKKPPRENQTIRANLGDVIYFREWKDSYDFTGFEAIGIFYGPEIVREWRGDSPVNLIGRIDPSQWDLIKSIGERVWRQGGERISIKVLDK